MKHIFTLSFLFVVFGLHAQERYLDEVFDEVTITEDVEYASNITVITALQGLPPMAMSQFIRSQSRGRQRSQSPASTRVASRR